MPLRRDASLIPLSHDHHHGLMRVFLIRQALRAGSDLVAEAVATRAFAVRDLQPHFAAEEEALFPVMRAAGCRLDLLDLLSDEHRRLRAMAAALDGNPQALEEFASLLETHIRLEERQLFAAYQIDVSEASRVAVEAGIRRILKRPA